MARQAEKIALAPTEWEIMKILWDRGAAAARDVFAALPADNAWAYKTVKTLLSRLVAKGAITYEQVGNSYLYRPAVEPEQMTREEVRGLLGRLRGLALSPLLAHFVDEADLSEEDLEQLSKLLSEKRRTTKKKRGH